MREVSVPMGAFLIYKGEDLFMEQENVIITGKDLEHFEMFLKNRENAEATIGKYMRDIRTFLRFAGEKTVITKEKLLAYKDWLILRYTVNSVNSMLVALNQFLSYLELGRLKLKRLKVQRTDIRYINRELNKEEFQKLVRTAKKAGKEQLAMMMETMCATGIRVGELKFFRRENIKKGVIRVWNKGKCRIVILPKLLRQKLYLYMKKRGIRRGIIFCTRTGKEKNRSNIWKEMKQVAKKAGVSPDKVFPHNLRHLFARTFYRETKNLLNLADLLGHSNLEVTRLYASQGLSEWKRNVERVNLLEKTT